MRAFKNPTKLCRFLCALLRSEEIEITYDAPSTVVYGVFGLKLV